MCRFSEPGSMYIALPGYIYCLVIAFRNWNPNVNTAYLGGISSAIYVMQFGIITVIMKAVQFANMSGDWVSWVVWFAVIIIPAGLYMLLRRTKVVKILF